MSERRDARASDRGRREAQLPSGLYQVEVDGAADHRAHRRREPERNFVRVLVGDRVVVELTPRDLTRGRIVESCEERRET